MGKVVPIEGNAIKLPDNTSKKRFSDKAKRLDQIRSDILKVRDHLSHVDIAMLIEIPLLDSSTLSLYNTLIESLELDVKRITERIV